MADFLTDELAAFGAPERGFVNVDLNRIVDPFEVESHELPSLLEVPVPICGGNFDAVARARRVVRAIVPCSSDHEPNSPQFLHLLPPIKMMVDRSQHGRPSDSDSKPTTGEDQ